MSRIRRHAAIAVVVATAAVLAGCATPVDESLKQAQDRMKAARADDGLRTLASGLLADAARSLEQAKQADEPEIRHHFIYIMGKNLDIAGAVVARKRSEQELDALRRRRDEIRAAARLPAKPPAPDPRAAADLAREMERERVDAAIGDARQTRAQSEKTEKTVEKLESRDASGPVAQAIPDIHFAAGTVTLSPGARRRLDPLIVRLRADTATRIVVEGYTDNSGAHAANLEVSLARAKAVKSYLVENGISAERVRTLGLGAQYPVASNRTEEGRSRNRRAEIVLDPTGGRAGPATERR